MELKNIISIACVLSFIVFVLSGSNVKRNYLLFILFSFPFIDLFITPVSLGGLKAFDIITLISVILLIKKPADGSWSSGVFTLCVSLLSCLLLVGSLNSEFIGSSLISLLQFCLVLTYAKLLLDECYADPSFVWTIIKALKLSALLSIVFLAFQLALGLHITLYELNPNVSKYDGLIRYPSFFQDPQKYGQFLAMTSFLFLIDQKSNKAYLLQMSLFVIIVVALFLTGVRAAFSGLCVGLLLIFILGERKYKLMGIACIVIFGLIILLYSSDLALFNRGANVNDSADVRIEYWKGALRIFDRSPLLGIGIGNYQQYVSLHAQDQYWEYFGTIEYIDHPESGYLKILTEFGLFASFLAFSLLFYPVLKAAKSLLTGLQSRILLFTTASFLSWLVAFLTVYSFGDLRIFILATTLLCLMHITSAKISPHQNI